MRDDAMIMVFLMDISHILDTLNDRQREAVASPLGNSLILAGAGSGKTRVLVRRIAWLLQVEHLSLHQILAVTFTNKAAQEMRERLQKMLSYPTSGMWVGTFHGLAHRILRQHWSDAGLVQNFQILDSDDQLRMVKRVIKMLNLDEDKWQAKQVQWFINGKKDEGCRPQHIDVRQMAHLKTMVDIYQAYEDACQRGGVIDFAEILLRAHELWLKNPTILEHYQQRFKAVLVDEFQDTNTIQYAWIKLLAQKGAHVMVVGDDDQSIYGWRGAKVENIQRFEQDFSATTTIRLEQNYRSTATILNAANALINHNDTRMGKQLWTAGVEGEPIDLYGAFNEIDEARFVVERLILLQEQGNVWNDMAILYRSNAQSRVFEEVLIRRGIPYRIYGGLRFFERAEIKDVLAYLRLLASRDDDAAFERVVNFPTRGIGEKTLGELRTLAKVTECSLWQALVLLVEKKSLPARAQQSLISFVNLINQLDQSCEGLSLAEVVEQTLQGSGLWQHFGKVKGEKAAARLDNMQELVSAAKQFDSEMRDDPSSPLVAFLGHAVLESGEEQADPHQDCVQLMTLHSAKGLEFPHVFMVGVEEGLFPSQRSTEEFARIEEERRLCYVGMTRAMVKLVLSYAEVRRLYGREHYHKASRFISELPPELIATVRVKSSSMKTTGTTVLCDSQALEQAGFRLGQEVNHPKFGQGVIMNFEGNDKQARVQVKFSRDGVKWLMLAYANLEVMV